MKRYSSGPFVHPFLSPCKHALATVVAGAILVAAAQLSAPAAHAHPEPAVPAQAAVDTDAVTEAADGFETGSAADAAKLADAATTEEAVPVEPTSTGLVAETEAGTVVVDQSGQTTVSAEGLPDIGIAVEGDPTAFEVVDGAIVQTEVAPSIDVVTRATDDGVQMIAILGDEGASNEIAFPMSLPDGAELVEQPDGSVAVMAELEFETIPDSEADRLVAEMDAIVGPVIDEDIELTPDQEAQLAAIDLPATETVTKTVQVGEIAAPWALDASGRPLETHYEIQADGITQIVETDENTAYPVTADPWYSWMSAALEAVYKAAAGPVLAAANYTFAVKLGLYISSTTKLTGGKCRAESSYSLTACWGGKLTALDGYGGGTTYGTTYYASKDPKTMSGMTTKKYKDLLTHEAVHVRQWKTYGIHFVAMYLVSEGIGRGLTGGKSGCGNIFEVMANLRKGNYKC